MDRVNMSQDTSPRERNIYRTKQTIEVLERQVADLVSCEERGILTKTGRRQLHQYRMQIIELKETFEE